MFINYCLDQLASEITNGAKNYDDYNNLKKQAAIQIENKNRSLLLKGKLDGQVEGEQVSIAHIINEKKKNHSRNIEELVNKTGEIKKTEREKEEIVYDFYMNLYKLEKNHLTPLSIAKHLKHK